jgi:hypothetical protein
MIVGGTVLAGAVFLGTLPTQARRAGEEPKEVIGRAIKAHGGVDALVRAARLSRSGKGQLLVPARTEFTSDEILDLPSRLRSVTEVGRNRLVRVLDGEHGWQQGIGPPTEMPAQRAAELQTEAYVLWVATLAPLLKDGFTFTALPESKVNGRPALGVRVAARGKPDLSLLFDKDSALLVEIACKGMDAGVAVSKEYLYAGFRDIDGARLPGRETLFLDGTKVHEITYSDYKLLRKVDEKAFERP